MKTTPAYQAVAWGFLALALLGSAAGSALNLYRQFWWYDEALHLYAIFACTLVLALYVYGSVLSGAADALLLLVLVTTSIGISLGVVWEVAEWAYDEMVRPNAIRGKTDTIVDLIMNALGALAAGCAALKILEVEKLRSGFYEDSGLVFAGEGGSLINPSNLRQRSFAPLLKRAGLPRITFHDLRHTCASLLFQKNVHPKFVQELLGHASVAITLDTYSHMLPGIGGEVTDAMGEALG